jgi:hypothetical protein
MDYSWEPGSCAIKLWIDVATIKNIGTVAIATSEKSD